MELSIVIPVYNEEENVEPLIGEIEGGVGGRREKPTRSSPSMTAAKIGTFMMLRQLHRTRSHLKVVRLKRNFGQTAAMAAGLAYAEGEVVVAHGW